MKLEKGKILLSEPYMSDGPFSRAVVLITDYSEESGAIGFILNKPVSVDVCGLIDDFPKIESEVFYGGPVAQETLHFIHDAGNLLVESTKIGDGVFWNGEFEKLKFLVNSKLILSQNIRFYLGYSGWSPGQLEDELACGTWVVAEMDRNYIFKSPSKGLWKQVLKNKGDRYSVIAEMPDVHILN